MKWGMPRGWRSFFWGFLLLSQREISREKLWILQGHKRKSVEKNDLTSSVEAGRCKVVIFTFERCYRMRQLASTRMQRVALEPVCSSKTLIFSPGQSSSFSQFPSAQPSSFLAFPFLSQALSWLLGSTPWQSLIEKGRARTSFFLYFSHFFFWEIIWKLLGKIGLY